MKYLFKLPILFLILLSPLLLYAQSSKVDKQDEASRISFASFYVKMVQEPNFKFDTPLGEGIANLILKSFRTNQVIPDFDLSGVDEADQAKIQELINELKDILKDPPDWDELAKMEEKRLFEWDKNTRRQSIYSK